MNFKHIFLLLIFPFAASAQSHTPDQQVQAFLSQIQAGQVDKAYDNIFKGTVLAQDKMQQIMLLKAQTKATLPLYGKCLGVEKIAQKDYGTSISRIIYILKTEKAPLIWNFFFYKTKDSFQVNLVHFNDQYHGLEIGKDFQPPVPPS